MRYGVKTASGNILATNGEVYAPMFIGPGGHCAKTWKTRAGAQRVADRYNGEIFEV